jgi:DNA-binding CsgD family transcriptional regulator
MSLTSLVGEPLGFVETVQKTRGGVESPIPAPTMELEFAERLDRRLRRARLLCDQAEQELLHFKAECAALSKVVRQMPPAPSRCRTGLTPQQARAVYLATLGYANSEIATVLHIGRETVKSHLSQAFRTLGVRSRFELPPPSSVPRWGNSARRTTTLPQGGMAEMIRTGHPFSRRSSRREDDHERIRRAAQPSPGDWCEALCGTGRLTHGS